MTRQNTILLNVAAGETTPEIYGRIDLPAFQRSYQRVQNYEVLPQGALRYRNGTQHVHNTKSLGVGRLIPFTFNQIDTYMLEFTNRYLQFYRALEAVLNNTTFSITGITNANPGVITTSAPHGYSTGQEVFLSGIQGMIELNNQFFYITVLSATTFSLTDLFGNAIDTTNFFAATANTGTVATAYGIKTPYLAQDLNQVHVSQSGDTITLTHQDYMPYELTRSGLTSWAINFFTRTGPDPFGQGQITAVTNANPGVFTLAAHGFKVGDTLYFDGWASGGGTWEALNQLPRTFTVASVTTNTFTINENGNPVDTSTFGVPGTFGTVIDTMNAPQTSAYLGMSRQVYANTRNNPSGLVASSLPDPTTGKTKFHDFTPGANDNNAFYFTPSPVFNQQDAIQWVTTNNQVIVLGCSGSIRQLTGSNGPTSGVTPSSVEANAISNTGAAAVQPYSNGLSVFYVDQTTYRVSSFMFSIQVYNYVTVNQNLIANQLSTSPFIALTQQRRESSLLWILRQDGVLAGLTFNEIESVYGWHRHYIGGKSELTGVSITRANVLSAAVEPRLNQDALLWLLVERELSNGNTYRSVEYWNEHVKFYDHYDYFGGESNQDAQAADVQAFKNATSEQLKQSIHLDMTLTYDGTRRGIAADAGLSFSLPPSYSISASALQRKTVLGQFVAFALGEYNPGEFSPLVCWDNVNQAAVQGGSGPFIPLAPDGVIGGESGIIVDGVNNIIYSQCYNYEVDGLNDSDTSLSVDALVPVDVTTITGPFNSPGHVNYPAFATKDDAFWQTVLLSPDKTTLYVSAGYDNLLKIDVATGNLLASAGGYTDLYTNAILLSPDGSTVYAVGGDTGGEGFRVRAYNTSDLSLASNVTFDVGHSYADGITGAAISSDGSKIALSGDSGPFSGGFPVTVGIYDTASVTGTAFAAGTDTTFSGAITFPLNDAAHVLMYLNGELIKFDLAGSTIATYPLGVPADDGSAQIVTEPNTGIIYGASWSSNPDFTQVVWAYDTESTTLVTAQNLTQDQADGSGIYYITFPEG